VSHTVIVSPNTDSSAFRIMTPAGAIGVAPDSMYHLRLQFTPTSLHNYVSTLRILHDGDLGMTEIPIYGNGAAGELRVTPQATWTLTRASSDSGIMIYNTGNAPLLIRGLAITSWKDSVQGAYMQLNQALPFSLAVGDSLRIPISFIPTAGSGDYYGTLQLLTDSYPDTTRVVSLHINANALGVAGALATSDPLSVYPNPARDAVTIDYRASGTPSEFQVYDVTGTAVKSFNVAGSTGSAEIDTRSLPSGQYYLNFSDTKGVHRAKLTVQH
jgi:hypothetical protein